MTASCDTLETIGSAAAEIGTHDMGHSGIGERLRAARERLGWTREALAYHAGVSWSAIAQIETGRRTDVRLRSLAALADALDVSVDYLIGTKAAIGAQLLEHRLLPYTSDAEFVDAVTPFFDDGLGRRYRCLLVTTRNRLRQVRGALGPVAKSVEFAEAKRWYRSPSAASSAYHSFVSEAHDAGAPWTRVVGEPVWDGQSPAETAAWTRYEAMVNVAFAASPATFVCPYNTETTPRRVVADAHTTHPHVGLEPQPDVSPAYSDPQDFLISRDRR